jgi:hypothetical protein
MSAIPSIINVVFHADLSTARAGEDHWVRAGGANRPLLPHTAASRAQARSADPRLAAIPDERLTHYTEPVALSTQKVTRVHVKHSSRSMPELGGAAVPSLVAMFVPPAPEQLLAAPSATAQLHIDHVSTAKVVCFHHPDLVSENPDIASIVFNYMDNNRVIAEQFEALGELIRELGPASVTAGQGWATLVPYTPPANSESGVSGKPTCFFNPGQVYMTAAGGAQTNMMLVTKNDPQLAGKKWRVQYGASVAPVSTGSAPQPASADAQVARLELTTTDDDWNIALTNTERVSGLQVSLSNIDSSTRSFTVNFADNCLRYLGLYIRFFDAEGQTISLTNWTPNGDDSATSTTWLIRQVLGPLIEYDDLQFIGYTSGTTTVLAIPTFDGTASVDITMPDGAVAAEVFGSGLGTGACPWDKTPLFGGSLTVLIDMVIPTFMLVGGAVSYSNATDKAAVDKLLKGKWRFAVAQMVYYLVDGLYNSVTDKKIDWAALVNIAKVLFQPASLELLLMMEAKMAVEEIEEEVPFAGWILLALNISLGVAELAETIVAFMTSPFNIGVGLCSTVTTTVTVLPDPLHQAFPQATPEQTAQLAVKLTYKGQQRPTRSATIEVPATTPSSLAVSFPDNTLGGEVKIDVYYYIDDWVAGQASTGWLDNDEQHTAAVTLAIVENPIPLDQSSIYQHAAILDYDGSNYVWRPTSTPPTATLANADTSSSGNAISQWVGLTLSQRYAALGYAWKAAGMGISSCSSGATGQLYAMQNVDIPGTPMTGLAFPSCGLDAAPQIVYDPYPPKFLMHNGQYVINPNTKQPVADPLDVSLGDYYVDPRKATNSTDADGGYHLRMIDLGGPSVSFDMGTNLGSWGRFSCYPDSICIHPSGAVIAVNTACGKLSITTLESEAQADDAVPLALDFAGAALDEGRAGLLFSPVAVSCSYDGTILVLEATKGGGSALATVPAVARIQAFDSSGNPVARFRDEDGNPTPFLPLAGVGEYTYLDLAAVGDEHTTYMYVLYYVGDGSDPSDYKVAIYQYGDQAPAVNPLVETSGVPAARITVDMWHSLYTLNYAMTANDGVTAGPVGASTGPAGRTVPSISEWLPPIPGDSE